jgi:Uma2 family endonuclease
MAMPNLVERYWTAEDVRALPDDGNRYECIDGVLLVTPSPSYSHGYAVEFLRKRLSEFVELNSLGQLFYAPSDVEIVARSLVQPDLFVARSVSGAHIRSASDISELVLAVEVLSPSTATRDRGVKRGFYQRAGVAEYWIVDLEARRIERWMPMSKRAELLNSALAWSPRGALETLEIDLVAYFAEVLDD